MTHKINKKYKDRLFRMVFHNKEDLLDLYNAVRGSHYTNHEDLEITTIDDVVYMGMKNDLSFLIDNVLSLYEHQSTFNPNMPVRGLLYLADVYRKIIVQRKLNLYSSKPIALPVPQYIVFYNGLQIMEERTELPLSDLFITSDQTVESCLDFKAIMININLGHNKKLMEQCAKLEQYALFVDRVRIYRVTKFPLTEAVTMAVDECIKEGILAEFLSAHKAEVINILLTEYDELAHIDIEKELSKKEGLEIGRKQGLEVGREQGLEQGQLLMSQLYKLLQKDGRLEAYEKAVDDLVYREELFQSYHLL